ncbi:MAG: hypothetical protein Q9169_004539 [Polycauliona sp. 2 TL-2023]
MPLGKNYYPSTGTVLCCYSAAAQSIDLKLSQVLSKSEEAALINGHVEWQDNKFLCVSSNDEAAINAALILFNKYINEEKLKVADPYEVTKLERLPATITKKAKLAASAQFDTDFKAQYQVPVQVDSSQVLVPHETVSRAWSLPANLIETPTRLLMMFEQIAGTANCRIGSTDKGMMTVKGDNDQDVSKTLKELDEFGRVLVYNLVVAEEGVNFRFRVISLDDHEASNYKSTTLIDQRLLASGSQKPKFAIILKVTTSGAILTHSRFNNIPYVNATWRYPSIPSHGDQDIDLAALTSKYPTAGNQTCMLNQPLQSITEWIETIGEDPLKPTIPAKTAVETLWNPWGSSKSDDVDDTIPPKRFGRSRKKPGMEDLVEIESDGGDSITDSLPQVTLQPDNAEGPDAIQLASTLSTSKTASSGSPKLPVDDSSSKPSTQSSAHTDILMIADSFIASPVILPTPATNVEKLQPPTSQGSRSGSRSKTAPPPAWVHRSVSSQVENKKPGMLVDFTESPSQPLSYVAAAKRGSHNMRGRTSSQGRAGMRGIADRSQPPAKSVHEAEPLEWVTPEVSKARKARSQRIATTGQTTQTNAAKISSGGPKVNNDSSQPDDTATIQLLQRARDLRGESVTIVVEIGRMLIKNDGKSGTLTSIYSAWSSIFGSDGLKPETLFTNRLPNPHTNLGFPSNIKAAGGQRIFADFHDCNSGGVQAFGPDYVAGSFQLHFPQRQWDARLIVKTSERIQDEYQQAVNAINSSLSIIPSLDQSTASVYADLGNSGLLFKSAMILRQVRSQCVADPDISMSCTEVQYLGAAMERQSFFSGSIVDQAAAEAKGDIWWEVMLNCNKLEQGSWTVEEVLRSGITQRLQAVAIDVVTHMDCIGSYIKQMEAPSGSGATESYKVPKVVGSTSATFW